MFHCNRLPLMSELKSVVSQREVANDFPILLSLQVKATSSKRLTTMIYEKVHDTQA